MPERLPVKLGKEPLIDAGCELVVDSDVDLDTVFPGMLFTKLAGVSRVEQIFAGVNSPGGDPANQAVVNGPGRAVRLHWNNYLIMISGRSVNVAPKLPYQGWAAYKAKAAEVFRLLLDAPFVKGVVRYSIKYVNLLESSDPVTQHRMLRWNMEVGGRQVRERATQLRTEFLDGDFLTIYQIAAGVIAEIVDQKTQRTGTLVDVDTLCATPFNDVKAFSGELEQRLDEIRLKNKTTFFGLLTPDTIKSLDPIYE